MLLTRREKQLINKIHKECGSVAKTRAILLADYDIPIPYKTIQYWLNPEKGREKQRGYQLTYINKKNKSESDIGAIEVRLKQANRILKKHCISAIVMPLGRTPTKDFIRKGLTRFEFKLSYSGSEPKNEGYINIFSDGNQPDMFELIPIKDTDDGIITGKVD